jgi:hypothetical protein
MYPLSARRIGNASRLRPAIEAFACRHCEMVRLRLRDGILALRSGHSFAALEGSNSDLTRTIMCL